MFEKNPIKKFLRNTLIGVTAAGITLGAVKMAHTPEDKLSNKKNHSKVKENKRTENYAENAIAQFEQKTGAKITLDHDQKISRNERDYNTFNLGVILDPTYDYEKEKELFGEDLQPHIYELCGGSFYYLDSKGLDYKYQAFKQMATKYGKNRLKQFVDFLLLSCQKVGESTEIKDRLNRYRQRLPKFKEGEQEELNRKLYNIADYLEEGKLEMLEKVFKNLKERGYQDIYDFSWDKEMLEKISSSEQEQQALLDLDQKYNFNQSNRAKKAIYIVKERIGEDFRNMLPTEKLTEFNDVYQELWFMDFSQK